MEKNHSMVSKGMFTDSTPLQQPQGTYNFALNALMGSKDGDANTITNEDGNIQCAGLPENYTVVGHVLLPDNNVVLFLADYTNTSSIIGLHDTRTCEFRTLINANCLGFKTYRQIRALTRVIKGCENMVYFTDRTTSYKSVNIDDLLYYVNPGYDVTTANADPANGWDCFKFNHFLTYLPGCISEIEIENAGGSLKYGAYQFTIRYLDKDLNPTNWQPLSNPVFIYSESTSSADPDTIDGEPIGNVSPKQVTLTIDNLDTRYSYVQVGVAESSAGTGIPNNAYILDARLISAVTMNYTYSGFDPNYHSITTVSDLTVPKIAVEAVEAHEQLDNRLFLANVQTFTEDWATLQRASLLATTRWFTYTDTEAPNINTQGAATKNPEILFTNKTFMRDEVYALGLVFVFDNNTESPVFHIPGRPANTTFGGIEISSLNIENHMYRGDNASGSLTNQWDTYLLTVVPLGNIDPNNPVDIDTKVSHLDVQHIPLSEFVNCSPSTCPTPVNITATFTNVAGDLYLELVGMNPNDTAVVRVVNKATTSGETLYDASYYFTSATGPQLVVGAWTGFGGPNIADVIYEINYAIEGTCVANVTTNELESGFTDPTEALVFTHDTSYLNVGCQIERWKVHNTAVTDVASAGEKYGYMGYYETVEHVYPPLYDCDGTSIYDASGLTGVVAATVGDLTGAPIRHHRIPDCALESTGKLVLSNYTDDTEERLIKKIGLAFNIQEVINNIPADILAKIIGYHIVIGERSEFNRTVLDKGYAWKTTNPYDLGLDTFDAGEKNMPYADMGLVEDTFGYISSGVQYEYVSPQITWNNKLYEGSYVKLERNVICNTYVDAPTIDRRGMETLSINYYTNNRCHYRGVHKYVDFDTRTYIDEKYTPLLPLYVPTIGYMRAINQSLLLPYNVIGTAPSGNEFSNAHGQQKKGVIGTTSKPIISYPSNNWKMWDVRELSDTIVNSGVSLPDLEEYGYVTGYYAVKVNRDVFYNLGSIIYQRFHNCMVDIGTIAPQLTGGDTFVTQTRTVKTFAYRNASINVDGMPEDYVNAYAIAFMGYVESTDVNGSLSHSDRPESQYAPKYFDYAYYLNYYADGTTGAGSTAGQVFNYEILNALESQDVRDELLTYGEYKFDYNKDFGKQNSSNPVFPLADSYDYCAECRAKEANSVYYTQKSFADDRKDNFKQILANSRVPIPSDAGEITNVFTEKDQLYVHTEKALWNIQTRPQQLNTNEATVYVGTGEIGSIPPKKVISTPQGYAGSQDALGTVSTQYGTFFVDAEAGRVFLFGQGLNEISNAGMSQWFKKELSIKFRTQFYDFAGFDYPNRDISNNNTVGFQAVFDPRMERIILHKNDFLLRPDRDFFGIKINPNPSPVALNGVYYEITDTDYVTFWVWNGIKYDEISLNDTNWFINKSWTMSYSLTLNAWISYHSYLPNYMYSDRMCMYSFINGHDYIWKHMMYNYQTYYNTKHDHILDITSTSGSPSMEKVFMSLQYISDVYDRDVDNLDIKVEDVTYDRFAAYNSKQACSVRDLIVKQPNSYNDITLPLNQTLVDRTDNYWRFNRVRDEIVDRTEPIFTKDYLELAPYYDSFGQGFIDEVINPLAVDVNKNMYELARLRDKYVGFRLFFNPIEDYKIVTELMSFLTNNSIR